MNKTLRIALQYLFFLGLGIFLLWWSAKDLDADQRQQLKNSLGNTRYVLVLPAIFILLLSHYCRALRWKILMQPLGYFPSTMNTFFAVMIGYLFNLLVPRLGEVMKCTILGKYEKVPADKLLGTIVAERAIDVVSLVIIVAITILTQLDVVGQYALKEFNHLFIDEWGRFKMNKLVWAIFAIIILVICLWWLILKNSEHRYVIKLKSLLMGVWMGIGSVGQIRKRGRFIFYTLVIWGLYLASVRLGFYAMEPVSHLGIRASLSVLTFGSLAMIVTQGGIGAYQFAIQKLMPLYGVDEADGLGFGWVLWAVQTGIVIVVGFFCFFLLPIFNRKKHAPISSSQE